MRVPGASLAIRVARVTPLKMTSSPSVPAYTPPAGIPAGDAPNRAMWRVSLAGSAPVGREDGTRKVRGSTSRKSRGMVPVYPRYGGPVEAARLRALGRGGLAEARAANDPP